MVRCGPKANTQSAADRPVTKGELTAFTFIIVVCDTWTLCYRNSIFRCFSVASGGAHSSFGVYCSVQPQNGRSEAKFEFKLRVSSWLAQISKYYSGLLTDWSFGKRKTPNDSSRSLFQMWLQICIRRVLSRERCWMRFIARGLLMFQRDNSRTGDTASTESRPCADYYVFIRFEIWNCKVAIK